MMKSKEFINKLEDVLKNYKTLYVRGCFGAPLVGKNVERYCNNHSYNKTATQTAKIKASADKTPPVFGFDCVCLVKGILWGWNGDTSKTYGGAAYASNGVPDVNADTIITKCTSVSTDFKNIVPGALVWMSGHVGVYVGNGEVIECTSAWTGNVLKSSLGNLGYKGTYTRNWTKWGKLPYVDYTEQTTKKTQKYVGYLDNATETTINGWAWNSIDDTALKVDIQISNGSKVVKTISTTANIYRSDLEKAKKGNGKHGFSVSFDFKTLGTGTYTVKAYTNGKALIGTKTVKVVVKKATTSTNSTVSTSQYYPKYTGKSIGLDTILKAIGVPSKYIGSWKARVPLAEAQGIKNYSGSVLQNSKLKSLAKNGKLKKI